MFITLGIIAPIQPNRVAFALAFIECILLNALLNYYMSFGICHLISSLRAMVGGMEFAIDFFWDTYQLFNFQRWRPAKFLSCFRPLGDAFAFVK